MSNAYISSISLYGGYSRDNISGSFSVADPDLHTTATYTLTDAECTRVQSLLWDIVDARKHAMAESVAKMQRPLLVDHSDNKTIDDNDYIIPGKPF